jgi:hypothetical protein
MIVCVRKALVGAVGAASLAALVAASATPAAAWGRERHFGGWGRGPGPGIAAGVLGGLALGGVIAGATRPTYAAPVYADPVYAPPAAYDAEDDAPACHLQWRHIYTPDGFFLRDQRVRVCD